MTGEPMSAQPLGIDSALSRIQQIQTYQQQLLDPSASTASTASAAGSSSSGTDFATLLASLDSGQSGTSSTDPGSSGELSALTALTSSNPTVLSALSSGSSGTPSAVQSMVSEANSLIGKPYVWGGGHTSWGPQTGYDCSGFVSAVLHAGGYLSTPQDTQTLAQSAGIVSGPGQYVTIYDRTDAGLGSDHVIIDLGGQFYESGGEAGSWGGGGGVEKIATPSASYLASFNRVLHPAGL